MSALKCSPLGFVSRYLVVVVACGMAAAGQAGPGRSPDGTTELTQKNCTYTASAGSAGTSGSSTCTPASTGVLPTTVQQKFPYPGETPAERQAAVPVVPTDAPAPVPASAAKRFPYPGEVPEAAPADAPAAVPAAQKGPQAYPGDPDAAKAGDGFSSSSSSSSSGGDSSADPGVDGPPLADAGSSGDGTKAERSKRKKLPKVDPQTPADREAEDLDVADFYSGHGNWKAAYERTTDAVLIAPEDPYAQFALAEAARKMGKPDEARVHYQLVLKLDPNAKQQKASLRALAELPAAGAAK